MKIRPKGRVVEMGHGYCHLLHHCDVISIVRSLSGEDFVLMRFNSLTDWIFIMHIDQNVVN